VRVLSTQLAEILWSAITLREHLWHRRDLSGKLAAIRHAVEGARSPAWGKATAGVVTTGPAAGLGIEADTDSQLAWLQRERPDYLLTFPSNAAALARTCLRKGIELHGLREIRTMGEALAGETRELCRAAWGVPLVDLYSAEEVGYIALQCPEHEHYHVQAETRVVEVLDESGQPCPPGGVGRVVVTDLNNFAMPLVRYELGDLAEAGPPCPCGRGLPVLSRILGRVRNMLVTKDGKRYFPTFGTRSMPGLEQLRQHQFVQKTFDLVEGRLVLSAPLDAELEEALRRHVLARLPSGFDVRFVSVDSVPRSPSGKFEDFVSEVAG
jgi:phenylacetate-CoA ligase